VPGRDRDDRLVTIPNLLSVLRLCCAPVFLWLLFGRDNRLGAAVLLGALGATDFVDGYIARHFDQTSKLGKVLDPVADRTLLAVGVIGILVDGSVPAWIAVAVLVREGAVSLAVVALAALGARRMDVTLVGKAGTFILLLAFPLFLLGHADVSWREQVRLLAWACAVPGLLLSYYSALSYVPAARRALAEGRADREERRRTSAESRATEAIGRQGRQRT
jgi:cardiolipin synthase